jgi:hypothetical protein
MTKSDNKIKDKSGKEFQIIITDKGLEIADSEGNEIEGLETNFCYSETDPPAIWKRKSGKLVSEIEHTVPYTPSILILDFIFRTTTFLLYKYGVIGTTWFWINQFLVISLIVLITGIISNTRAEKNWKSKINGLYKKIKIDLKDDSVIKISPKGSLSLFLIFSLLIVYGFFISFSDIQGYNLILKTIFLILIFAAQFIWAFFIWIMSTQDISLNPQEEIESLNDEEDMDKNDINIIEMQAVLLNLKQKIDTYTIESALLGALSLSAYLTIMQTKIVTIDSMTITASKINNIIHNALTMDFHAVSIKITELLNEQSIWNCIAFVSVVTSLLYFLLIVSRKKIHDRLIETEKHHAIAKSFNDKEEELINMLYGNEDNKDLKARLEKVSSICNSNIHKSQVKFKDLNLSVKYADYLRKIATFSFVLLIFLSFSLISSQISSIGLSIYILVEFVFFIEGERKFKFGLLKKIFRK